MHQVFFFALDRRGAFPQPVLHTWQGLTSHGTLIISDMGLKLCLLKNRIPLM